jgi:hypothetical protein
MVADTRGQDEVKETRMFQNWMKASSASISNDFTKAEKKDIYSFYRELEGVIFTRSHRGPSPMRISYHSPVWRAGPGVSSCQQFLVGSAVKLSLPQNNVFDATEIKVLHMRNRVYCIPNSSQQEKV